MKTAHENITYLLILLLACLSGPVKGQIKLPKLPDLDILNISPDAFINKYFDRQPIQTSFKDAKTEVDILGDFEPAENLFLPLNSLDRKPNGDYILKEGLYTTHAKSFCLKAGTYGPSKGDGHLYAPLTGPQAFLIKKILENWQVKHPEIPQNRVQGLLWALIARTSPEKLNTEYKAVLIALLDKDDIKQLATNMLKNKLIEKALDKFKDKIPAPVLAVIEAERKLRNLFAEANTKFEEIEQYAVLAGMAPVSNRIREISKGRWSYHPNGYFIRYFPQGYSRTRVDVYIPHKMKSEADAQGRIQAIAWGDNNRISFLYGKANAGGQENFSAVQLSEIKIASPFTGNNRTIPIKGGNLNFLKNDTDFLGIANAHQLVQSFIKRIAPKGALLFNTNNSDKVKLYNTESLMQGLNSDAPQASAPEIMKYIRFSLSEAHNYNIYQSLSINRDSLTTEGAGNEREILLNLPSTVAVPANTSGQRIGISSDPIEDIFRDLPACPCTYQEAQQLAGNPASGWLDCGGASQEYHYGAANEVRWAPQQPGKPGQQCTYDQQGRLIKSGIAAGSPDRVSPGTCGVPTLNVLQHYFADVKPWSQIPCKEYLKNWPANNGNNCMADAPNAINDIQLALMGELAGNMTCEQMTALFVKANTSNFISPQLKQFFKGEYQVFADKSDLIRALNVWAAKESCPAVPSFFCRALFEAIRNLGGVPVQ